MLEDIAFRKCVRRIPVAARVKPLRGLDHGVLIGPCNGDKAAVADDLDTALAQPVGRLVVYAFEARIVMRGTHDAGVQHARQLHIVQEEVTAGNDFRQAERCDFLADDPVG